MSVEVKVALVGGYSNVKIPKQQSAKAAGMDLCAATDDYIKPNGIATIPTGLVFEIPEGYEGQVRPRSGLASKYGITVLNAPGTIDSDYRGEVKVILVNHSSGDFIVSAGDRIAQLVIAPVTPVSMVEVGQEELSGTERGAGGFGSTGVK